jgi:site-specific DNA recombinase
VGKIEQEVSMKTRVIGYIRVSTGEQAEEGHSLYAQRLAIEEFCHARGWELVAVEADAGFSGTRDDRRALRELLQAVERGECDVVVVHAIDRFYRDLQGLLQAFNHLRQHNVTFVSVRENLDFSTPWGKLTLAVLGTLAEIYIDRLRQETRKGKVARATKGLHNGSPPFGYCQGGCASCTDPNGPGYCPRHGGPNIQDYTPALPLVPHPIEREAVRLAFEWYATGEYSDGDVADRLNEYVHTLPDSADASHPNQVRFRTKGRHGRGKPAIFRKDSVRELLQRPFYAGLVPYFGVTQEGCKRKRTGAVALYPGQHEAIVAQETFERCRRVRASMGRHPRSCSDWRERVYVLSGILTCGYCGLPMRAQSGNGVRYYQDKSRAQHLADCPQTFVHADDVEEQFARLVQSIELPPNWREEIVARLHPELDADEIREREEAIQARLERARELYIEGDIDRLQYVREKLECQARLTDLRPPNYHDIISAGQVLEAASEWHTFEPFNKKERARTLFTTVLIRGTRLVAAKPTDACYALIQLSVGARWLVLGEEGHRNNGSDGI